MSPTYTSLEDGQVIKTKEPRPDLDELARWVRSDVDPEPESAGSVSHSTEPVAGPVNTAPVTGGVPPLTSTSAGIADPASALTPEQAQAAADAALGAAGPASDAAGAGDGQQPSGEPLPRPALNGTTEDWLAYAKQDSVALDVPDDAGREAIVAAYIEKFAPAGNASGADWGQYAADHGVQVDPEDGRDKIRAAVVEAGWAKA